MTAKIEKINQTFIITDHLDINKVVIRGCKWQGEYEVDILYYESRANYIMTCVLKERVTCKRISTINKRLAARGLNCKMI